MILCNIMLLILIVLDLTIYIHCFISIEQKKDNGITISLYLPYFIGDLCMSPSHGTIQGGGILTVTGPSLNRQLENQQIRLRFEGENEVLYTNCTFRAVLVNMAVLCPVPLFSPNSAGVKNVTLLIGNCTKGFTGKYRVGECPCTSMK